MSAEKHGQRWTREEHLLAFNLYCRLPFGKLHHRNPEIIKLAHTLDRTPDSVAMKLSNFASLDPSLSARGIVGLASFARGVADIWVDFESDPQQLAFECDEVLSKRLHTPLEEVAEIETRDLPPEGLEREAIVRQRVNQSFFRRRVLSVFDGRCCVTGIAIPELLVASHIVPWSQDKKNRLNPRNGLCLNALHDRAFDRGMMWIEKDYTIRFADALRDEEECQTSGIEWLRSFEGRCLRLPPRFAPDPELLQLHRLAADAGRR